MEDEVFWSDVLKTELESVVLIQGSVEAELISFRKLDLLLGVSVDYFLRVFSFV